MVSAVRQRLMHARAGVVEQPLMPALLHEGAQRAGGERREIDRRQLRGDAAGDEGHQPGGLRRRHGFGQQPQREAREILALLAVAQPVGDERAEIDLAQFGLDRRRFEEMHLDEFAELVGDAVLVALDDRGVRDRQAQRPLEQRDHGVPVGEAADGGGFGKGRDEAEGGMHRQHPFRADEDRKRRRQHQRRQQLDAAQLGGARGVAGRVDDEGAGKCRHDGFRRCAPMSSRAAVNARSCEAIQLSTRNWIASSLRVLAMTRSTCHVAPKRRPAEAGLRIGYSRRRDQAVLL